MEVIESFQHAQKNTTSTVGKMAFSLLQGFAWGAVTGLRFIKPESGESRKSAIARCLMQTGPALLSTVLVSTVALKYRGVASARAKREEERRVLAQCCLDAVKGWEGLSVSDVVVKPLDGGLTNTLYTCEVRKGVDVDTKCVVMRIYPGGAEACEFFARDLEVALSRELSHVPGLGPAILAELPGHTGRIEAFLPGRTLQTQDICDVDTALMCARAMAKMHQQKPRQPFMSPDPVLWRNIREWRHKALLLKSENNTNSIYKSNNGGDESNGSLEHRVMRRIASRDMDSAIYWLQAHLAAFESPVVLCHNDFQEGNLILEGGDPSNEGEPSTLHVIDFEYSNLNNRGFDLGNHFCEMYITYSNPCFPFFTVGAAAAAAGSDNGASPSDLAFPSESLRLSFAAAYLEAMGEDPSSAPSLVKEAYSFMLASHLQWAIWSAVMAQSGTEIDFGYWEYADARLREFDRMRATL